MAGPGQHRLGKAEEARRWLNKAQEWLDHYPDGLPARAEERFVLHRHNWLEAHVLPRPSTGWQWPFPTSLTRERSTAG
jgi:hypothetical protein